MRPNTDTYTKWHIYVLNTFYLLSIATTSYSTPTALMHTRIRYTGVICTVSLEWRTYPYDSSYFLSYTHFYTCEGILLITSCVMYVYGTCHLCRGKSSKILGLFCLHEVIVRTDICQVNIVEQYAKDMCMQDKRVVYDKRLLSVPCECWEISKVYLHVFWNKVQHIKVNVYCVFCTIGPARSISTSHLV